MAGTATIASSGNSALSLSINGLLARTRSVGVTLVGTSSRFDRTNDRTVWRKTDSRCCSAAADGTRLVSVLAPGKTISYGDRMGPGTGSCGVSLTPPFRTLSAAESCGVTFSTCRHHHFVGARSPVASEFFRSSKQRRAANRAEFEPHGASPLSRTISFFRNSSGLASGEIRS